MFAYSAISAMIQRQTKEFQRLQNEQMEAIEGLLLKSDKAAAAANLAAPSGVGGMHEMSIKEVERLLDEIRLGKKVLPSST